MQGKIVSKIALYFADGGAVAAGGAADMEGIGECAEMLSGVLKPRRHCSPLCGARRPTLPDD